MTNIYATLKLEYEKKRLHNYYIRQERIDLVYTKVPQIRIIDNKIKKLGVKYNLHVITNPSDTTSIDALRRDISALTSEKVLLLTKSGFDAHFLDMIYDCPHCKDTGMILNGYTSSTCHCFKQKYINLVFGQSNLAIVDKENFDSFDESLYSDSVDLKKFNISPRQNILQIKANVLKFIQNFDDSKTKNLLFIGNTGMGKTFMLNCIARELLLKFKSVIYKTSTQLFDIINKYKLQLSSESPSNSDDYQQIFSVDLLIIDDLGTEPQSNSKYSELLNILNRRKSSNLKTIASTNMNLSEILEIYSERVFSRINEDFDILRFFGHDIRIVKRKKGL